MGNVIGIPSTRVSDLFIRQRLTNQVQLDQLELFRIQTQLSTGRRFQMPSEDCSAASRAMSLQRLLERKDQVQQNLATNQSYLSATDTALSTVSANLAEVRGVALNALNFGPNDDTSRAAAAQQAQQLVRQLQDVGNQKFRGRYLFAGTGTTILPFGETDFGFIQYYGNEARLSSYSDIDLLFDTNLHGNEVFGAISAKVLGAADLNPILTYNTRLADLRSGQGITPGSIAISAGGKTSTVDVTNAETIGDVAALIRANPPEGRSLDVQITPTGLVIELDGAPGDLLRIREVGGGTTADDLGILTDTGTGAPVIGEDLDPVLRLTSRVADILGVRASAVVRSIGSDNDLIFEADTQGDQLNGVNVLMIDDGTVAVGNEQVTYDPDDPAGPTITINIDGNASRAVDVIAAVDAAHYQGILPFTARIDPLDGQFGGLGVVTLSATGTTASGSAAAVRLAAAGTLTASSYGEDNDVLITANVEGEGEGSIRVKYLLGMAGAIDPATGLPDADHQELAVNYLPPAGGTPGTIEVTLETTPWEYATGDFSNNGQDFTITADVAGTEFDGVTVDIADTAAAAESITYNHTTKVITVELTAAANLVTDLETLINNDPTAGTLFTMTTSDVGPLDHLVATTGNTSGGVDGGAVISTANDVISEINDELTGAGADVTAALAPGDGGLGTVTPFQEFAFYGTEANNNRLQFLGPENSSNVRFVLNAASQPLEVDLTTDPRVLDRATTLVQGVNADSTFRVTAAVGKEGPGYDDVEIVFTDNAGLTPNTVEWDQQNKKLILDVNVGVTTAGEVINLINNNPYVSEYFGAQILGPGPGAGVIHASMVRDTQAGDDPLAMTSGGVTSEGTIIVKLGTDADQQVTTTAQELIDYFDDPANAAMLGPLGISVTGAEGSNSSGLLAETVTDLVFATAGTDLQDAQASATINTAWGQDAQITITAVEAGAAYNGVVVQFENTVLAGNEAVIYDPATKTLTFSIQSGVSTANQVLAALVGDPIVSLLFTGVAVGTGGDPMTANDTGTLSGGVVDNGSQDGAAMLGNEDAGPAEFDLDSGLQIVNDGDTHVITFTDAETIEDVLNVLNMSDAGVLAEINENATGINIRSRLSGCDFMIGENGGTTATGLGLRTFTRDTRLEDLNYGSGDYGEVEFGGVHTEDGTDFTITIASTLPPPNEDPIQIDLSGLETIGDVLDLINSKDPGNLEARLATYGNGIELVDRSSGSNTLTVTRSKLSEAAIELGLIPRGQPSNAATTPGILTGADVNYLETEGVFTALLRLQTALNSGDSVQDSHEIRRAIIILDQQDLRMNFARAELGARQQGLDHLQYRLEDENIDLREALSADLDVDIVEAISNFTGRQAAFEASLRSTAQIFSMTLLNYI